MVGHSIRQILCPVDFSAHSARALQHALAYAACFGARVSVLHVHGSADLLRFADRDRLAGELRAFVVGVVAPDSDVEWRLEEASDVRRAILSRACASRADLVVMGTHGRSGFERLLLGSVAERVMRTSSMPVLVVPPNAPAPTLGEWRCSRIVCATDFSSGSSAALSYAAHMAYQTGAALTVAHIVELPDQFEDDVPVDLTPYRLARFERARTALTAAMAELPPGVHGDPLLLAGRAGREILRLASEQLADVIVMGVHGRGAVDRMVFGSVTEHVVRRAVTPLLSVPL